MDLKASMCSDIWERKGTGINERTMPLKKADTGISIHTGARQQDLSSLQESGEQPIKSSNGHILDRGCQNHGVTLPSHDAS